MSTLKSGCESNAGLLYKLLAGNGPQRGLSVHYEHGIQWRDWSSMRDVMEGRGINRQIRRVYGVLASRYRPGDRIFLFGYSRGAYAVRSLAGVIGRMGLLRADSATVRNIRQAYRHYESGAESPVAKKFREIHCHAEAEIELLGAFDTVKALGMRWPILWRFTETKHRFHNHELGHHIRHAYHALARDETRDAFAPVLWRGTQGFPGVVEQMWFRGVHGDIGGQLGGDEAARGLANIPLVWMLEKAAATGLTMPSDWALRFPVDTGAPSIGSMRGWGPMFLARHARVMCQDPSEQVHDSAKRSEPPSSASIFPEWLGARFLGRTLR